MEKCKIKLLLYYRVGFDGYTYVNHVSIKGTLAAYCNLKEFHENIKETIMTCVDYRAHGFYEEDELNLLKWTKQ